MFCTRCGGDMNPINLEQSVYECTQCRFRQHKNLPDLDVGFVAADLDKKHAYELPLPAFDLFRHNGGFEDI